LAGSQDLVKEVVQKLKYPAAKIVILNSSFDRDESSEIFAEARQWLQAETRRSLEDALIEFQGAEKLKQAQKNIFQIAKAAVKGRISKLFVTEGIQIFGKLDSRTGGVSINPDHMDHEDDDLLDDLAQTVLATGGEVIVLSKDQNLSGRPILAILKDKAGGLK